MTPPAWLSPSTSWPYERRDCGNVLTGCARRSPGSARSDAGSIPAGSTVALDDEGLLTCTDVQVRRPSSCVAPWRRPGAAALRTRRGLDGASDADRAPATMAEDRKSVV